jgi:hypothetical protein
MWCWRKIGIISWIDHVRNKAVVQRTKENRNILHTIKRRNAKWFGHFLYTICHLKHVTEEKLKGKIEVVKRRGRRYKHLLEEPNQKLLETENGRANRILNRTQFGRGYGLVLRQSI